MAMTNKLRSITKEQFSDEIRRLISSIGVSQREAYNLLREDGLDAEFRSFQNWIGAATKPGNERIAWVLDRLGHYARRAERDDPHSPSTAKTRSPGQTDISVMSFPYLEGGPGAGGAGVQWDEGERITVPTSVAAAWANGRRVDGSRAYWTRVQGSSMEPWLPDQSPIFVERSSEVVDGGRYVLWLDDVDAEIVKRIERLGGGYLRIISDNPNHATQLLRHVQDDVYEDEATQAKVRVRIRGRVLCPPDTPHAILKTVTEQMARMMGRDDR